MMALKTSDKVLKYGENNKVDFSEHPTVVKRGSVRATPHNELKKEKESG